MADRRIANGIYRTTYGWRLYVRVNKKLRPKRIHDPQHDLDLADLKLKRDDWRVEARGPTVKVTGAGFDADAAKYLTARQAMTGIKARRKQIALWVAEFGNRPRASIQPWEILAIRDRWLTVGPKTVYREHQRVSIAAPLSASTVNQRLRALENLWTVLDGRRAPNPVREVQEAAEPEAAARGLPVELVEAILARMPDRRYGRALTSGDAAAIRRALRGRRHWGDITALAAKHRVSETMIRKVAAGRADRDDQPSATKLRLRAIFLNGLSHGELMAITETDLHLDAVPPWVWIAGRRKGKGTTGTAQPLTAKGAAVLQALADAKALGKFSRDSMRASFRRAWTKLDLAGLRPYDLRHSYATDVFTRTGNLDITQLLMRQRDKRTTLRYGKGAVPPLLAAAIARLQEDGVTSTGNLSPKNERKPKTSGEALKALRRGKPRRT